MISGLIPISCGGTGARNTTEARQNLNAVGVGDFGIGRQSVYSIIDNTPPTKTEFRTYGASITNKINKDLVGMSLSWAAAGAGRAIKVFACEGGNAAYPNWYGLTYSDSATIPYTQMFYTTGNAKTDRNGHLKVSGISDDLSDYPVGAPIPWPQATAPSGFLVCNGQSFNKTTYPLLAKAYPTGALPDLRGEFLRGLDAGRGVDSGRAVLSAQVDAFRAHNHSVIGEDSGSGTAYFGRGNGSRRSITKDAMNLEGGTETRPRNIAFLYIVRAA
ncbi:TPA: tail fiber protein [Providencia rettgeri]|nr:tail fiber protein [Providencia rettgeri]